MVVENRIIEKCLFIIFFNIENCNIDTYFKSLAHYLQAGQKKRQAHHIFIFPQNLKIGASAYGVKKRTIVRKTLATEERNRGRE